MAWTFLMQRMRNEAEHVQQIQLEAQVIFRGRSGTSARGSASRRSLCGREWRVERDATRPRRDASDPLEQHRDALADADAHRRDARGGRRGLQGVDGGGARRAPDMPRGWPRAMAPPFGLTFGVVGQAELAQHRQRLRGERLVQLDHVDLGERQAGRRQQLLHRR